jgi:enolase
MQIKSLKARQILDSRATPTIEVDLVLADGSFGRAAVPSGASTGAYEALELRDEDKSKYHGKGVLKAVENVGKIMQAVNGKEFATQSELDMFLLDLDGTENKANLGANAILGVSLAFAVATAKSLNLPVYKYVNQIYGGQMSLPRPMFNIMNGGKHANWSTDIQEFMVLPLGMTSWAEQLRAGSEIFLSLEKLLKGKKLSTNVGNEGGFAPILESNKVALDLIMEAISNAGYEPGKQIALGLDVASSEFAIDNGNGGKNYELKTENRVLTADEWRETLVSWSQTYPLISIEDPFDQDDWSSWQQLTAQVQGTNVEQIVGDDLLVTNVKRIERAIGEKSCNALLVKLNQIGSLTETMNAMKAATAAGWNNVVSHRSGETEDVFISHLAVGTGAGQLKSGAPSRGERTAKFNELIRIEEEL